MQGYCGACSRASAMVVHLMPMVESWRLMIWLGEQAFLFGHVLYLNFTLTCKAVCCSIFNKLHHHIFLSYELTQGGAPCDEAAH